MRGTALTVFVAILAALWSAGCRRHSTDTQPAPSGETGTPDKSPGGKTATSGKNEGTVPKKGSDDSTTLRKEKLLGRWEGKFGTGSISLSFTDNPGGLEGSPEWRVVGVSIDESGAFSAAGLAYRIAATANEVEISSPGGATAVARPTKDGVLLLSGQLQVGNASITITDTRLERVKESDSKK